MLDTYVRALWRPAISVYLTPLELSVEMFVASAIAGDFAFYYNGDNQHSTPHNFLCIAHYKRPLTWRRRLLRIRRARHARGPDSCKYSEADELWIRKSPTLPSLPGSTPQHPPIARPRLHLQSCCLTCRNPSFAQCHCQPATRPRFQRQQYSGIDYQVNIDTAQCHFPQVSDPRNTEDLVPDQ